MIKRNKKIQELTTLQQGILSQAGLAIIATDLNGTITLFNPAAEQMLGYRANELIGKKTPEVFHDLNEVVERAKLFSRQFNESIKLTFRTTK
ncbi:MAG: PAS domain S-box protein [Legionellaceae bacterium]